MGMITQEMIDFIYLACEQTTEESWFNWSPYLLDFCEKFVAGQTLTEDEEYEIALCYDTLQDDEWDYINKCFKSETVSN